MNFSNLEEMTCSALVKFTTHKKIKPVSTEVEKSRLISEWLRKAVAWADKGS